MPVDTRINVPFVPQEGITGQILQAMQLANEHHNQQQQLGIQQQQANTQQQNANTQQTSVQQAGQKIPSEIDLNKAAADRNTAASKLAGVQTDYEKETNPINKAKLQTDLDSAQLDLKRKQTLYQFLGSATGSSFLGKQIDTIAPPDSPDPAISGLNQRTKTMVDASLQVGDIDGARKAVEHAGNVLDQLSNEHFVQGREDVRQANNRQAQFGNTLQKAGLDQLDKMFTDPQHGYAQFLAQANATKTDLASAKDGNQLASSLAPLMTVLGVNSFAGVHRVNPMEYEAAGPEMGSLFRRANAILDKAGTGTLPPDSVKEMGQVIDGLIKAKHASLIPAARMVATNSGIDPAKTMVMDAQGNMASLDDVANGKSATATAKSAAAPKAKTFTYNPTTGKLE